MDLEGRKGDQGEFMYEKTQIPVDEDRLWAACLQMVSKIVSDSKIYR